MSVEPGVGIQSVDNLLYGEGITIYQGENAHNIINVIHRHQDDAKNAGVKIIRNNIRSEKDVEEYVEDDDSDQDFPLKKVQEAMEEIASIQLLSQSQLRTLLLILDSQVKLNDAAGFFQTHTKIYHLIHNLPTIEEAFLLAVAYKEQSKEFQAFVICKHLITWAKCNVEKEGGAKSCLKNMTEHYMSLACDAALKLLWRNSDENDIYKPYLISLMNEMSAETEEVECTEKCFKASCEAMAGYYVACIHLTLEEWEATCQVCDRVILMMQERCKRPRKKLVYADVMFMSGLAKYNMNKFRDAKRVWKKTIEVYRQRHNNDAEKDRKIGLIEGWLNITRQKLSEEPLTIEREIVGKPSR